MTRLKKITALLIAVLLVFSISGAFSGDVYADSTWIDVKASVPKKTQVKLSWKKRSVSRWRIYILRDDLSEKLVKTVSGKSRSCTLKVKSGKYYYYLIEGQKKIKGKYQTRYRGDISVYAGMQLYIWDEYQIEENTSPSGITLRFDSSCTGMKAKGIDVYRKVYGSKKKFKKVARVSLSTLKKKKYRYVDKKVSAGKKYTYKCRSYGKYKGKTIYGPWTEKYSLEAANINASFDMSDVSYDNDSQTFTFALTSDAGNGDFVFNKDDVGDVPDQDDYELTAQLMQYSTDDRNWEPLSKYTLKPGRKVYLKMKVTVYDRDGNEVTSIPSDLDLQAQCYEIGTTYLERPVYLPLDVSEKSIQTYLDEEAIH